LVTRKGFEQNTRNEWMVLGSNDIEAARLGKNMRNAHEEFEQLVLNYQRRIYNVALRLASDKDEAADLTQETFVRAFRAWSDFRRQSQVYTWLYRILVNLNKDRVAREAKKREREISFETTGDWDGNSHKSLSRDKSPAELVEVADFQRDLANAIHDLPPGYKECIILRELEGLSYDEIAEVMGITTEAVRSRLARARQQLRQQLISYIHTER
jgi:RNA polymerase sigma-70 factor (ECF subfamily)